MTKAIWIVIYSIFVHCVCSIACYEQYAEWTQQGPDNCVNASAVICKHMKYRTIDGSCNNIQNPTLGMALTLYHRLLPPNYGDKISSMPRSKSGKPLPSARLLSYGISGRIPIPDQNFTLLNMQWGQIVAHDTTMRLPAMSPFLKPTEPKMQECCSSKGRYETLASISACFPVPVPKNDPIFRKQDCINFERSVTDKDQKCRDTEDPIPAEQLNGVTHYLDLSFLYGNNKDVTRFLRKYRKGQLRTGDRKSKWPPRSPFPMFVCDKSRSSGICYEFGDVRGNQNPPLAALTIVLLREHNRIARELHKLNECWSDEKLFQEARRINIAQFQYITYYEWLANLYGKQTLLENEIIFDSKPDEYINDYDPFVDPRTIQAFSHAAYRYFHTQVVGRLELYNEQREYMNESYSLSEYMNNPSPLEVGCKYSSFIRGLVTQPSDSTDNNFDIDVTDNFMHPGTYATKGLRLVDIQRSRDHGLPSYNDYRALCGLKKAAKWDDYSDYIQAKYIEKLRNIYESHEDVDLIIGAGLEEHEPGALVGPTFLCISLLQVKNYRTGDRYFFENQMQPYPFSKEQLMEIRKASAARILCDNSDVEHMQPNAFRLISNSNPLKKCSQLPKIDLSKWYDERPCALKGSSGFFDGIYRKIIGSFDGL